MSYETKMYSQIAKAQSFTEKDHRKYQAYELAAAYAAKAESITNKAALILELTKKSKAAYAAYI